MIYNPLINLSYHSHYTDGTEVVLNIILSVFPYKVRFYIIIHNQIIEVNIHEYKKFVNVI